MLFLSKANSSQFLKSFFNSAALTKRDQVNKSGLSFFIILLSAGILFTYTVLRARLLSFVHDESSSYFIINHIGHWWSTANNHLLNSFLMIVCQKIFGESELSLRLPNLFAHLLFMIFSILILKKLKDDILTTSGFLLLNTNPFMLDFFGLARGYGLSLSFMMISIYYFVKTQEAQHQYNKMLFYTFYFANLAILSNFMILNYYLSIIVVIFLSELINNKRTSLNKWKLFFKLNSHIIIFNLIFLLFFMPILFFLKFKGAFFVGGKRDFWHDTVISLIKASLYSVVDQQKNISLIFFAILILVILNSILALYLSLKYRKLTLSTQFLLILIICIISPIVQFYLFDTPYPVERTGLFYIPLFFIMVIFGLKDFSAEFIKFSRTFCIPFLLLLCVISCGHLIANINFTSTYVWSYDACTKKMMEDLRKEYDPAKGGKICLGVHWLFEPTVNYYKMSRKFDALEVVTRAEFLNKNNDYYYFFEGEKDNLTENNINIITIKNYFPNNTILAKHIKNGPP
jgi:hypothetical protein